MIRSAHDIESSFHSFIQKLDEAHEQVFQGKIMNLAALKFEADRLCAEVLRQNGPEARAIQPLIGDAITRLDALESALKDFKERIQS